MLHTLNVGDLVRVWPRPGHVVPERPPTVIDTPSGPLVMNGRALQPGDEVAWSPWLQEMARHGAIFFSDPGKDGEGIFHAVHADDAAVQVADASALKVGGDDGGDKTARGKAQKAKE